MYLLQRMNELVGHNISFGGNALSKGVLEEIGDDFVAIRFTGCMPGHLEEMGNRWLFKMKGLLPIVHLNDCKKCELESAIQSVV